MPRWADRDNRRYRVEPLRLLQLVIIIILISLLILVAAWRVLPLRGHAEAAHVTTVIGGLRSAVGLTVAETVVRDGLAALSALDGSNPMALLQEWPERYRGPVLSDQRATVPPGYWYFEPDTGRLGYRVRFTQYLAEPRQDPIHLRWRLTLGFDDLDGSGHFNPDTDRVRSLALEPEQDWIWP